VTRNRNTAKRAGAAFERAVADYLKETLGDDSIDRQVKTGSRDLGDIRGVTDTHGNPIAVECKDYGGRLHPTTWIREAHTEAANKNTNTGIIIAKRRGTTRPGDQWVITTLEDLTHLIGRKEPE
jgi:hypothetical protein